MNWRIVNPALEPPRVEFESADEQATLREFAARDASLRGYQLLKSEDDGKTWTQVEARAPDAASAGEKAEQRKARDDAEASDPDKSKSEGSRKASK
jgi:hypothetical protein